MAATGRRSSRPSAPRRCALVGMLMFSLALLAGPVIAAPLNEIAGTDDADRINGTTGPDRILGGKGNDILRGRAGDDRLVGGPGDDLLIGGPGKDTHVCGRGEDVVVVNSSSATERIGTGCESVIA